MTSANSDTGLKFQSWGFTLYTPPTLFHGPEGNERSRFVMLDDINDVLYDIDYEHAALGNRRPWPQLALHEVEDPVIVFLPEQQELLIPGERNVIQREELEELSQNELDELEKRQCAIGWLVDVGDRSGGIITGRKMGKVMIKPLRLTMIDWEAAQSRKGPELPNEMRNGLLRRIWNRRPDADPEAIPFVTPAHILNEMPRRWHEEGDTLNYELDQIFMGGSVIDRGTRFEIHGLDVAEIAKSAKSEELRQKLSSLGHVNFRP